jgi:nitrate/TMAO reductase-like tetraheme cytochrome c subunit
MNLRAAAAALLVGAVVAAAFVLSRAPATPTHAPPVTPPRQGTGAPAAVKGPDAAPAAPAAAREPFQVAEDCRSCHQDVWDEWKTSYHGKAWTDPMVQQLSNGFRMPECIDCHAPLPIHVTGVAQRVAPRKHSRGDGVDCITCHLMDDGVSVAATRDVDTSATPAACRPRKVDEMANATVCAGCHNQHETLNELADSGIGKTCADCHMTPVDRAVAAAPGGAAPAAAPRKGRSHVFPGAHDPEMHRRAAKLEVAVEAGAVVARVTNVGAGHKMPTDARHRSYNLFVSVTDARGNPLVVNLPMPEGEMRLYYRDQFKPTTQVAYGKTHVATWPVPEGIKGRATVRLTYALNPDELGAGRVTEVQQAEVEIQ